MESLAGPNFVKFSLIKPQIEQAKKVCSRVCASVGKFAAFYLISFFLPSSLLEHKIVQKKFVHSTKFHLKAHMSLGYLFSPPIALFPSSHISPTRDAFSLSPQRITY